MRPLPFLYVGNFYSLTARKFGNLGKTRKNQELPAQQPNFQTLTITFCRTQVLARLFTRKLLFIGHADFKILNLKRPWSRLQNEQNLLFSPKFSFTKIIDSTKLKKKSVLVASRNLYIYIYVYNIGPLWLCVAEMSVTSFRGGISLSVTQIGL